MFLQRYGLSGDIPYHVKYALIGELNSTNARVEKASMIAIDENNSTGHIRKTVSGVLHETFDFNIQMIRGVSLQIGTVSVEAKNATDAMLNIIIAYHDIKVAMTKNVSELYEWRQKAQYEFDKLQAILEEEIENHDAMSNYLHTWTDFLQSWYSYVFTLKRFILNNFISDELAEIIVGDLYDTMATFTYAAKLSVGVLDEGPVATAPVAG